ncbi:MAG TPA: IPT/TIG domain-containing protein, partial [Candidatus Acidoferrales bacterium]|nr:IPT/TIG domain-containing protein [Candidatus Acidoferrales bacterium]
VVLDSALRTGARINARYAADPKALIGSATETADNTFDLFVAIPAPSASSAGSAPGSAALSGPYWAVTLEFPGGVTANARNTQFSLSPAAAGRLADFSVMGHAANIAQGLPQTQQMTGATYTLNADGTGTASFGTAAATQLISGSKNLYVSADGNVVIGGSVTTGSHDFLIAVKAVSGVTNATWNNKFWGAGLRVDPNAVTGYSGSMAAGGAAKVYWTKREKAMGAGVFDFTGINGYSLNADGSGTMELTQVGLGAGGKAFVGSAINRSDTAAYEIFFGVQLPALSGSGVFLSPLGVVNAASSAPPGNPISPGQFITLYGTGLAKSTQTAAPPYPATLNGVTVLVNNKQAPLYFVSPGQINALVPYTTQGTTATIVVQNGSVNSNTVTVPLAATAPGVYSLDQSGSGPGAILHADFGLVNAGRPAAPGETVLIYLTGMGAVAPAVADGTAGGSNPLNKSVADVVVLVAGQPATLLYNGLAPGFPGLYQINVTLPTLLSGGGNLPLAIQTNNAYHDQVDIPIR